MEAGDQPANRHAVILSNAKDLCIPPARPTTSAVILSNAKDLCTASGSAVFYASRRTTDAQSRIPEREDTRQTQPQAPAGATDNSPGRSPGSRQKKRFRPRRAPTTYPQKLHQTRHENNPKHLNQLSRVPPSSFAWAGMFSYHREFLHWQLNVPPCLGTQTLSRELVERPEDWLCSSFRHHFTGAYGVVEIESGWGTQRRERLGIIPTVRIRSDIQNPAQATLERGTLGSRFEA